MSLISHAQNILTVVAAAGVVSLLLSYLLYLVFSPIKATPGPLYTRFTTLVYKYHALQGQRINYIHSLHQKYGPVVRVSPYEVSIIDLKAVREIHRVSTPFLKSPWYSIFTGRLPPNVFVFRDPHDHRTRRSILAQPMSENALKKVEPIVNTNIEKTIDGMETENAQTGTTDIFKWFTYMATDVIGELAFGESFRMLDKVTPNQYYYDLRNLGTMSQYRGELDYFVYILGALRLPPFKDAVALIGRLRNYATQSVLRYEKLIEENPTDPKPTLLTKLYNKGSEGFLPRSDIIREGMGYIVAGSDTTATSSTYMVYHILKTPGVREKLIAELAEIPENFSWDDLRGLPYLNNTITETLRLSGAAPGSLKRDVPAGGADLAGYHFPAGTIVSTQSYTLHRDPAIYSNPEKFDPDRWINPTPDMNHAFLAFGSGTRICIGMHLAKDEMRFAVAKFFRRFPNARIVESDEGMQQASYFLMGPKSKQCLVDLGLPRKF